MSYRLKKESPEFTVMDGPMEGRKFRHGEVYQEVPEGEKGRFEGITPPAPLLPQEGEKIKKKEVKENE